MEKEAVTGQDGLQGPREAGQACCCPRCQSPNTVKVDEAAGPGYRKCIVCGNRWRAERLRCKRDAQGHNGLG